MLDLVHFTGLHMHDRIPCNSYATDAMAYGSEGTTQILKTNFVRYMRSEAHRKCEEIETGCPSDKKQKTVTHVFGGANMNAFYMIHNLSK